MVQICCKEQSSFGALKEKYRQKPHSVCWTSTCPEVTWTGRLGALTEAATNHDKTVQFGRARILGKLFCAQMYLKALKNSRGNHKKRHCWGIQWHSPGSRIVSLISRKHFRSPQPRTIYCSIDTSALTHTTFLPSAVSHRLEKSHS